MSSMKPEIGAITWVDLTVQDADTVRDFYSGVVGWKHEAVKMGTYNDYSMMVASGQPAAGICHARGVNAGLPAQWLIYITVADLDASVAQVETLGGRVLVQPKSMGTMGRYCVVQDPAGAVAALFEPASSSATP